MGAALVEQGLGLVFGGGRIGMMGTLARTVLEGAGEVIGVIPKALHEMDLGLKEATELRVVRDMHERKALMADLADAFIALPGGFGTMEELFEILTWAQLGFHGKPAGLLNVSGYFDDMIQFANHATDEGFIDAAHRGLLLVDETAGGLLTQLASYEPPQMDKAEWILRVKLE
jgi:uncharacterized protein (TIGR00730 family)